MRYKILKFIIFPILLFILSIGFLLFFLSSADYFFISIFYKKLLSISVVILSFVCFVYCLFSIYRYISNLSVQKSNKNEINLKRAETFEGFYDLFYSYSEEKVLNAEILKTLKKKFTQLSLYVSDKTIKLFNDFFSQSQDYLIDSSLSKEQLKFRRVSFEECVLALREELGLDAKNNKSISEVLKTKSLFTQMEHDWYKWNRVRIWFFETCRDYGTIGLDYMKKNNFIFIGGGPKGFSSEVIKQIKKDDLIISYKRNEGYISIGKVTVETKTIAWPKDNPVFYMDGEIRIPIRWLLFLNLGVYNEYVPSGQLTRLKDLKKVIPIISAMRKHALEAGNEYEKSEINKLIETLTNLTKIRDNNFPINN